MRAEPRPVTVLDLGGAGWLVRESLGLTWQWYAGATLAGDAPGNNAADAAAAAATGPGWLPATVPGSVVTDLHRAGELPDPYVGRNSRAAEWVATRSWVHRRMVDLPALADAERAVLELDGVDPGATVVWDGEVIGQVSGLYRRHRLDVTAHLGGRTAGRHVLAVVVAPAPDSQPQVGRTELVRLHAPRMSYGWDFCPRLVHQGIWQPVRVVVGPVHLADVAARTEVDGDGTGRLHVTATVEGPADTELHIELLDEHGEVVADARAAPDPTGAAGSVLEVPRPDLWWPNGFGPQPLSTLRVRAVGGGAVAQRVLRVGFRRVEMVPNPDAPPGALPCTAVVNGRRIELLGWNWVPVDVQYGAADPARLEHLLDLAVDSGACLLRVWGGGLVETRAFYEGCDRRGLLVWQELSQSSSGMQSAPATDDAFVAHLRDEARVVVPARTHHPSLLMWGGGNELDSGGVPLDEARSPVLAALREEVRRLDPGRHWVPTSPSGPVFHNRLDVIAERPQDLHDVHGPWEHQGLGAHEALYDAGTCLAHTEFGVEGMTNLRTLRALVPEAQRWPPGRENPVYRHLGEWWDNAPLVQMSFGGRLRTIEQVQRASQLLQATGLAYAVEADRRRAPRCSMVLPWQLGESYPNAWCTCVVDHRGDPKPALHAVRRAFAADRVLLQAATTAWAGHDTVTGTAWVWSRDGVPAGSVVTSRLRDAWGTVLAERSVTVPDPVGRPRPVLDHTTPVNRLPAGAVLVRELGWRRPDGSVIDAEAVLATTGPDLSALLDLPPARVAVESRTAGDRWRLSVRHLGGPAAVGLQAVDARESTAPGWAVVTGDPRPLLPGQARTVEIRWEGDHRAGAAEHRRAVTVEGWNVAPHVIAGDG